MGTNVIYLADRAVPSYLRPRALPQHACGAWSAFAHERTARQRALARAPSNGAPLHAGRAESPVSTVRVTHRSDAPVLGSSARLRISGRLVDVCAELERLAAAEAEAAAPRPQRA